MKDIKELLKDKDLTFGTERTIKRLRIGDVKSVFIAKNCPENVRKTIKHYAKLVNVEVNDLDKLYGAISEAEIAKVIEAEGFSVDKKDIVIEKPIEELGIFEIGVKLHPEVTAKVRVWVTKK